MDKTLIKGLMLLEVLARSGRTMTVTELALALAFGRSNVHRILQTLIQCGHVMQAEDGSYAVTLRLWELGAAVFEQVDVAKLATLHLRALAEDSGETAFLGILDGDDILFIDKVDCANPVRRFIRRGSRAPLFCSASGKAILAHLPDERAVAALRNAEQRPGRPMMTLAALRRDLAQVRANGFAIYGGEWEPGVRGVAAPILDPTGEPIAAIGVTAPEHRMPDGSYPAFGARVKAAASAVAAMLRGGGQSPAIAATQLHRVRP